MQLAEYSVPKINFATSCDNRETEGGLFFCAFREGVREFSLRFPAAKMLIVSDTSALEAVATVPKNERTVFLVLNEEDCLPLFSMPDGVSSVVAVGRGKTLFAARYFAEVREVPCAVFPTDGTCRGAFETQARLSCGGVLTVAPLAPCEPFCDVSLIHNAGAAYASLLLSRLALIEARALRAFRIPCGNDRAEERAYALLCKLPKEPNAEEVVRWNAELRRTESVGAHCGEGAMLAELLKSEGVAEPEWCAFSQLSALYYTFFMRGKPRRYHVPNYAARSVSAETEYLAQRIPTEAEFATRSVALEATRARFATETAALIKRSYRRAFLALGGRPQKATLSALKKLPEHVHGLCAVIRDFGLMDW